MIESYKAVKQLKPGAQPPPDQKQYKQNLKIARQAFAMTITLGPHKEQQRDPIQPLTHGTSLCTERLHLFRHPYLPEKAFCQLRQ